MKHSLLISLSFFTLSLFSQPIITSYVNPTIGTTDLANSYDASLYTEGPSGANVTWDFSSISSIGSASVDWKDPSSNTNSGQFSGTNIIGDQPGGIFFAKSNGSEWTMVGSILSGIVIDNYSADPRELLKFPLTYQTVYNETFDGTQDNGTLSYDRGGTIKIEGDGYGTLILPYGTITNVLRVKVTTIYSDIYLGTTIADYEDVSYQWYHGANKYFLLSWGYLDASVGGGSPIRSYIGNFLDQTSVGIEDNSFKHFAFSMAPNPARNQIEIKFDSDSRENMSLEIFDMTGRNVMTKTIAENVGEVNEIIDVGNLKRGLYSVILKYNDGILSQKLIIE